MWPIGPAEFPHRSTGQKLTALGESQDGQQLSDGTVTTYMFSAKPTEGRYRDYEHKVLTYIEIVEREARAMEPLATAQKWRVERPSTAESVFEYMETASARQGTADVAAKVAGERVAIVGLGGTGAYVLDFVAKTQVAEIHLYDDDRFLQHNAFRAPGSVGIEELDGGPYKAEFHAARFNVFRSGVVAHATRIDEGNVRELAEYDTVFLCIDGNVIKRHILDTCEESGRVCIDMGMGLYRVDDKLGGIVRTTTSEPLQRRHIRERKTNRHGWGEDRENTSETFKWWN